MLEAVETLFVAFCASRRHRRHLAAVSRIASMKSALSEAYAEAQALGSFQLLYAHALKSAFGENPFVTNSFSGGGQHALREIARRYVGTRSVPKRS
jgi:hypothetical protein